MDLNRGPALLVGEAPPRVLAQSSALIQYREPGGPGLSRSSQAPPRVRPQPSALIQSREPEAPARLPQAPPREWKPLKLSRIDRELGAVKLRQAPPRVPAQSAEHDVPHYRQVL